MISQINLQYFKCFESLKLPLRPLTLLSGGNAAGKSSVLQTLVLLHQTMREHEWSSRLMLNGNTIRLGTAAEIIDQVYGHHTCVISLRDDDDSHFAWEFEGERHEMSLALRRTWGESAIHSRWDINDASQTLQYLLPLSVGDHSMTDRLRSLTYLTAERLGPREYYQFDDPQLTPVVGSRGEYSISVLQSGRDGQVLPGLLDKNIPPTRFRQVEARMARFFPGCVLEIAQVQRANAITLGIRISNETDFHRPVHTGFGLTQVLPIVVAALSAQKNDLLLIENPEVHLHPAAQGAMGIFLSQVAAAGVQVVLETHSDHLLNGIRRAVKTGIVPCEDVSLLFFRPRTENMEERNSQVESPAIDANGNIDSWPEGFFDQFDQDMNYLAGWS